MEQNWDLMQVLADKRLVVTGGDETSQTVEIVHEVLIRHWGRMQEWLKEDRAFRVWQNNLRLAINDWQENQDKGLLLRNPKLAEAKANLINYAELLNANEKNFIRTSLNEADVELAKKKRQRNFYKFLFLIPILFFIAGWQFLLAKKSSLSSFIQSSDSHFTAGENWDALQVSLRAAKLFRTIPLLERFDPSLRTQISQSVLQAVYQIREYKRLEDKDSGYIIPESALGQIDWSPDGESLAFVRGQRQNNGREPVIVMRPDSNTLTMECEIKDVSLC